MQRVNIQYSVEIEKLPQEVGRLVKLTESKFKNIKHIPVNKNGSVDITLNSVQQIVELRGLLAQLDHDLMDIENIMNGYINFLSAPQPQEQQPREEVYADQELVDDLESKIENFKNSIKNVSPNDQVPTKKQISKQQVHRNNN